MQPIAYKRDRFILVAQGCFVMSQTPDDFSESSFGWPRNITSWVRLRSRASGQELYVFNTHIAANYGPIGSGGKGVPREEWLSHQADQANVLLSQIRSINSEDLPVMLSGDFNSTLQKDPVSAARTVSRALWRAVTASSSKPPISAPVSPLNADANGTGSSGRASRTSLALHGSVGSRRRARSVSRMVTASSGVR